MAHQKTAPPKRDLAKNRLIYIEAWRYLPCARSKNFTRALTYVVSFLNAKEALREKACWHIVELAYLVVSLPEPATTHRFSVVCE